ncbi:MAG: TPR repeat protein [Alphaproteobacteria bacterium]|jgi:TPR repeat protein
MHRRSPLFILLVTALLILTGGTTEAEEYWEGYDALDRGDYRAALKIYHRLAENGDARSQDDFAYMYYIGLGTKQDFTKAAKWFRRAADQGHPPSLFNLGILHQNGHGIPQNNITAHHWFNLAGFLATESEARQLATGHRESIAGRMTASAIREATERSCIWWRSFSKRKSRTDQHMVGCEVFSPGSRAISQ